MDRRTAHRGAADAPPRNATSGGNWRFTPRGGRVATALLAAFGVLVALAASSAIGQSTQVAVSPAPQIPASAVKLGPAPGNTTVSGAVVLRPRDAQALDSFIEEATSKSSPRFGKYLSKGEFAARFGPSAATVADVREQLSRDGLNLGTTSDGGLLVRFSGSATHVASAFATGLERYRLPDGRLVRATTSAPTLPQSLAGSVATVVGLDEITHPHRLQVRAKLSQISLHAASTGAAFKHPAGSPQPCHDATADARQAGGLTDDQIANAYGAFGLYALGDTGAGVHIGIYEQEPFLASDIRRFDSCYFGATAAASMIGRLSVVPIEGGSTQGPGEGEASLDVEDVSAMAPGASIDVYDAPESLAGELSEITAMVDEDRDQIITSSWGEPCEQEAEDGEPGVQQAESYLFQQAAAQGQTFMNAAGDTGSDACEEVHREVNVQRGQAPVSTTELASQPYVLAVGGTTITNAATQPAEEHVWNDGPEGGGGGGGISQAWAMPSWQRDSAVPGIVLPGNAEYTNAASVQQSFGYPSGFCDATLQGATSTTPCRLVPDVSAQADEYTGAPTVYSEAFKGSGEYDTPDGWVTTGGTSSASPIWAAMLALVDASPTCRSSAATASGIGFASPLLYAVASSPTAYSASFNDITEGNNDVYGLDGGKVYPATTGYDMASGLGSPRVSGPGGSAGLAYYLCSYAGHAIRPAVTSLSPSSGPTVGGEIVKVTGSGFENAGSADVSGVQVGAWHAAASAIHVLSNTALTVTLPPARDTLPAGAPPPQGGAGAVQVIVTIADGQSSAPGPASAFQYVDGSHNGSLPNVSGLSPSGGQESAPTPVTLLGSGFSDATSVTFGAVNASTFKILSDSQIQVTPPPYSPQTACAPLPKTGVYAGESAGNDICQVQVVVHGPSGASATGKILAPLEGAPTAEQDGALEAPPGCGCEVYPAATEFDYAPAPEITSVSTSQGAASLASETGETLVTVHGRGLSRFTFDYAFFGQPGLESSLAYGISFASGTELQITAPAIASSPQTATLQPTSLPFSVRTLAGYSAPTPIEYAGVPRVSAVANTTSKITLEGVGGAPDTGGTPLSISGKGMEGQVTVVRFEGTEGPESQGTNYAFNATSDKRLLTQTVSQNPALVNVQACTVSGCSATSNGDQLYLYPPGQAAVESLTPSKGNSAGGTTVIVHGQNLGCPLAVAFGESQAESFTPVQALLACGSTTAVDAVSPAGSPGSEVPVTVTTLESYFTGSGDAPSTARFRFTGP
ncbi:MAG TPA: protease pro-enzyme activation domain-containing protein [Solirubrobacteraceae bacterium]|nr:protease pro-enzyme activation domain-containing protein [Solirubrobacteraceae bacterium]